MSRASIRRRLTIDPDAEDVVLKYANVDIPVLLRVADAAQDDIDLCLDCRPDSSWGRYCGDHHRVGPALETLESLP